MINNFTTYWVLNRSGTILDVLQELSYLIFLFNSFNHLPRTESLLSFMFPEKQNQYEKRERGRRRKRKRETEIYYRNWLTWWWSWEVPSSAIYKTEAPKAGGVNQSKGLTTEGPISVSVWVRRSKKQECQGPRQEKRDVSAPQAEIEFALSSPVHSIQALSGLDDAYLHWGGCSLLGLGMQMLLSFKATFTDVSRNNAYQWSGHPLSPAKLTSKSNHHGNLL